MSNTGGQDAVIEAPIAHSPTDDAELIDESEHAAGKSKDVPMPSQQHQQVELLKKKYGGLLPKKPPLISKDHEHAFFDSADWALGKQGGQKPKGPLEALRPKLEPTPHHHARSWRSTFAPPPDGQDVGNDDDKNGDEDACCEEVDAKNGVESSEGDNAQPGDAANP